MKMADVLFDDLLLKHIPLWGADKVANVKLLFENGDDFKKARLRKMLILSARKHFNDSFLNNHVLLPPSSQQECLGKGEVFLGSVCYGKDDKGEHSTLYPLFLDLDDIQNHIVLSGTSGVGKTCLAYNIVAQLAKQKQNVIVFDWNRSWRNFLALSEEENPFVKNVRVFTIGRDIMPFNYNIFFSPPKNVNPLNWLGIIAGKPLQKSLMSGLGVENLLINECEQLISAYQQGTLKLIPNIEDIKKRIENTYLKGRAGLWQQSAIRVLSELCRPSIKEVFGSRNPIDIAGEILEQKGPSITVFEMDLEFPYHLRILFQEAILHYLLLHYMGKGETNSLRVAVVLEEFQNMLPQSYHERQVGGEIIKNLFRESRKFGIGLISIAQEASELGNFVLSNSKTQIHFTTTTKKDIDTVASGLFLKPHEIRFLDMTWRGFAFVKIKGRIQNTLIKTPPPPFTGKVTDEELKEISKKWQHQN